MPTSSDEDDAPAQPAARRRTPPEVINIDHSRRHRTTRPRTRKIAPEPRPSSTAAPTPSSDSSDDDDEAPRRGAYSFCAQPAATPSLSLKAMKQAIKDAGPPTADLCERQHVEERYAQAKARLAEPSGSRRSRAANGARQGPARHAAAATAAATEPAARDDGSRQRREVGLRAGVRVVIAMAWRVWARATSAAKRSGSDLRRHQACNRRSYDMAFQKSGARRQTDWRLMKNK